MPLRIGYYRVSTADQNTDLQINALKQAQCDKIYGDHGISGAQKSRPEFDKALNDLKATDTLVIWRLDRMSRSLKHLLEINHTLTLKGAFFESVTEKIDTSTPMGEFVFHILGAVAQLELSIIRERTRAGLNAAKLQGRCGGRPRKLTDEQISYAAKSLISSNRNCEDIAQELGVHPETIRRHLGRLSISSTHSLVEVSS